MIWQILEKTMQIITFRVSSSVPVKHTSTNTQQMLLHFKIYMPFSFSGILLWKISHKTDI